ncbi:golgin subfamily A member 6-like protein 25 [Phymastichus coffea]|uniref:golgin subfamily A member 6-like protein 25 n=1 Tax=Phymastichus coffea TaxID=108790 RepID=UPI00273B5089|nr:golgin subfamily A member 6-like protein 25 [Phymastichus coffea]
MEAANMDAEAGAGEQETLRRGRGKPKKQENEKKGNEKIDIRAYLQKEEESNEAGFVKSDKITRSQPRKADVRVSNKKEEKHCEIVQRTEGKGEVSDDEDEETEQEEDDEKDVEEAQESEGKVGEVDKEENGEKIEKNKDGKGGRKSNNKSTNTRDDGSNSEGEELKELQRRIRKMEEQRRIDEQAAEQAKETVRRAVEKFDDKLAEMEKRMEERMREQEERLEAKINKPKRNSRCRREEGEKENESAENESNEEQEREEAQRPDDDQQGTRDRSNAEGGEEPKVNKPDAMKLGEYEYEMKERRSRKNNVFIRGVRTSGKRLKEEIEGIILGTTRKQYNIEKMKPLRGGLLLTFEYFREKIEFMEQAEHFEKIGIRVEEERTPREIEVQEWIETIAEQERRNITKCKWVT